MVNNTLPVGTRIVKVRNYNVALITYNGEEKTVREWAKQIGINKQTLWVRIFDKGWSIDRAFTEKAHSMKYAEYTTWPELKVWQSMKVRCERSSVKEFKYYGARGIKVCERWAESFVNFITDMGRRPVGRYTLERVDNDKGYDPGNVIWDLQSNQVKNTRRNIKIEFNGRTMIMSDWANEVGLSPSTLRNRLFLMKWSIERALTTPSRQGRSK